MRILLILLIVITSYAGETVVLSSTVGASIAHTIIESRLKSYERYHNPVIFNEPLSELVFPESVRLLLKEPQKPRISIDYGKTPFSKHLEALTRDLLQYPLLLNIYTAVNDPIDLSPPENRVRVTFTVNRLELKLTYSF